MNWQELRPTAEKVCTEKQLRALELRYAGMTLRQIAFAEDLALATVVDRIKRAEQRVNIAQKKAEQVAV